MQMHPEKHPTFLAAPICSTQAHMPKNQMTQHSGIVVVGSALMTFKYISHAKMAATRPLCLMQQPTEIAVTITSPVERSQLQ